MREPHEIELKFDVPESQFGRLTRLPLLRRAKPGKTATLSSVYFDTPGQKLHSNGLSLRVRRLDGRHVQTIKQHNNRSVGLFERDEWEYEVDRREPDLDAAQASARSCDTI